MPQVICQMHTDTAFPGRVQKSALNHLFMHAQHGCWSWSIGTSAACRHQCQQPWQYGQCRSETAIDLLPRACQNLHVYSMHHWTSFGDVPWFITGTAPQIHAAVPRYAGWRTCMAPLSSAIPSGQSASGRGQQTYLTCYRPINHAADGVVCCAQSSC